MKQKLLLLAVATLLSVASVFAQNKTGISGDVKDNTGKPAVSATVMLHRAKDSAMVKTAVTDAKGHYEIAGIQPGSYFLMTSVVSMKMTSSPVIEVKEGVTATAGDITLQPADKNLQGVTVVAKKPMVEVKADKTILNVEGTINAVGNDALELLRKAPGVMIDKDDNLSLAGKNGVQVYIDGKPSPLSGADLANYLKSMQSSQIEAIELITNPSAKYEAAGNAGIINIKLKKNKSLGTNGSVNAGYAIGTYGKYNAGLSLNNRGKKTNIFGTYNFNHGLNENTFVLYRKQGDTTFNQTNRMLMKNKYSHNFKVGMDYFIDNKNTIGVVVNGNVSASDMDTDGPMYFTDKNNNVVKVLRSSNFNKTKRENTNFNLNYRYAVTGGTELNIDADYGYFNLDGNQFQPNYYYDGSNTVPLFSNVYRMISPTNIDIYAFKVDYEKNFMKGRLGFGGKLGYVTTDNNFKRYNVYGNTDVYDTSKSNRFKYKENINAVYANYNRQFKGFMVQLGVRVENTNSDGKSTGMRWDNGSGSYKNFDSTLDRSYTDVFPSAAITFNKNPMNQFGFTFSRRIDRPAYQDLNPFEFKINDYSYMRGNTKLRPQYTNSFGITHTYGYKLNTQLNYSRVKDIFTQLVDTTDKSKSFLTRENLASQDIVSLNISYPFNYKWYSFFANFNGYYSHYKANFGGGDRVIDQEVWAMQFFMQNSFKLGKGFTAELSGFYISPTLWQGAFKSIAMYSVDGGIQKTLFKGKANIKAAVSDIFKTMKWKGTSDFSGQVSTASGRWESRQFKINFSYRFGNSQVKAARQRKAAIEDESKRTQSSGGIGGQ